MTTQITGGGFVRLVDTMGDDAAIVEAARVSYQKGTKTTRDDESLIRYLVRNGHTSPLEMVVFKFHIKCPIFIARQWMRHRMASYNEVSGRYSEIPEEFYTPYRFCKQSKDNKQGSDEWVGTQLHNVCKRSYDDAAEGAFKVYRGLLSSGVSREQARGILPLSTYTEFYWKVDLHNLFNFLRLRLDYHAQEEIRGFANAIAYEVKSLTPLAYKAWRDYVMDAPRASAVAVRALIASGGDMECFSQYLKTHVDSASERREILQNFGKYMEGV